MPRRRKSVDPASANAVLMERINNLEQRLATLQQTKMSSVQTFDPRPVIESSPQGHIGIDYNNGQLVYKHDLDWWAERGISTISGISGGYHDSSWTMSIGNPLYTGVDWDTFSSTPRETDIFKPLPRDGNSWDIGNQGPWAYNNGSIMIKEPGLYRLESTWQIGADSPGNRYALRPYYWRTLNGVVTADTSSLWSTEGTLLSEFHTVDALADSPSLLYYILLGGRAGPYDVPAYVGGVQAFVLEGAEIHNRGDTDIGSYQFWVERISSDYPLYEL